jgi:hypothetical protein
VKSYPLPENDKGSNKLRVCYSTELFGILNKKVSFGKQLHTYLFSQRVTKRIDRTDLIIKKYLQCSFQIVKRPRIQIQSHAPKRWDKTKDLESPRSAACQ